MGRGTDNVRREFKILGKNLGKGEEGELISAWRGIS